jgi:uncharacterized protein
MNHALVAIIRLYQWVLAPVKTVLFGPWGCCRFTPTCSQYAIDALRQHGVGRALYLTVRRLLRCHPWGGCGHDPVPTQAQSLPKLSSAWIENHS